MIVVVDELSIEKLEEQLDTLKQNFREKEGLVEDIKETYQLYRMCFCFNDSTVPGSIKLYKVDNHCENVMGSIKIHNEMKTQAYFCADFLSMSKSSFTVIYRIKIFTGNTK